ncbi:hypothetical protein X801_04531, partial [Opisthorchis viverrini]
MHVDLEKLQTLKEWEKQITVHGPKWHHNVGRSKKHWSREFKDRRIASQLAKVYPFIYAACRLKIDPCDAVKHTEEPFAVYCVSPDPSGIHQSRIRRKLFFRFYALLLRSEHSSDSSIRDPKSAAFERAEEPAGADVCLPGVFAVSTPKPVRPSSTALGLEQEFSEPSKTANQGDRDVLHRSPSSITPSSQQSIPSNPSSSAWPSVSLPVASLISLACSSTPSSSASIDMISTILPTCTLVSSPISRPSLPNSQCSPEYYTPLEPPEPTDLDFLTAEPTQRSLVTSNWDATPIVHSSINGDAGSTLPNSQCSPEYYTPLESTEPTDLDVLPGEPTQQSLVTSNWDATPIVHPPVNGDAESTSGSTLVTQNNPVPICDTSVLQTEGGSIDTSSNTNSTNSPVTRIFRSLLDAGRFVRRFSTGRTPQLMEKPTGKTVDHSPSLQSTSSSEIASSIPDRPSRLFVSSRPPRLVNSILNRMRRSVQLRQKTRLTVFHQAKWAHTTTHRAVHTDLSPGRLERHALVSSPGWPQWTLLTSEESDEIITSVTPDQRNPSNLRIRSLPTHHLARTHHSPLIRGPRRKKRFEELQPLLLKVVNDITAIDEIKLPICSRSKLRELMDQFVYRRKYT